jgi:Rap1a immunity proteins
MRTLVAIVLLVVTQAPARSQAIVASTVSTTVLIDGCRRAGDQLRMDCAGYVLGVYDQMSFSRLICPPSNPNGGTAQAVAVALKFLNDHPEQWHLAPVLLIEQSFKTAFPCGARQD